MKALIILAILFSALLFNLHAQTQKTFNSQRDLNKYIYNNSDLHQLTKGYFLDYLPDAIPELKDSLINNFNPNIKQFATVDKILEYLRIVEETDINGAYNSELLFNQSMDAVYSNNGWNTTKVPLFIGSIDFSYLNHETTASLMKHTSTDPFPQLSANQFKHHSLSTAGLLIDTLVNNHIQIYWDDNTVVTNSQKRIRSVQLIIGKDTVFLPKNINFSLDDYYTYNTPLTSISYKISLEDGTRFTVTNKVFLLKYSKEDKVLVIDDSAKSGNTAPWFMLNGGFEEVASISGFGVRLDFSVLWGCDSKGEKTLNKPYIMVSGWGPYTDISLINNSLGWPSTIQDFYFSINQKGFVDSLVGAGYDVIFAKFFPPNASAQINSLKIIQLINLVNTEKFSQGSFQENVISGYSAGSMAVRLALEMMEKERLDNPVNPHHHCKLFVSFDGEQGGANVPLGLQHSVKFLKTYFTPTSSAGLNFTIYALNYILNAQLSKELLHYFHTSTGNSVFPHQGAHPARVSLTNMFSNFNHSKNTHNPGYPAFTRNVSLSNGTSHRTSQSPLSSYFPYAPENGKQIFFNEKTTSIGLFTPIKLRTQVYLLGRSDGLVFRAEYKPLFDPWEIMMEAKTSNALILDNAPGGTTFLADPNGCKDQNIMYQVLKRLEKKTQFWGIGDADLVDYKAMYSFTPTIFTHDIRNFTPTNIPGGGLPYYDMKAQGLMFTNITDINNINFASSYYGYPHLAHPTNHYMNYTPFDAVFAWNEENSVHIQSGHAFWNDNGENLGCPISFTDFIGGNNDNHKRWEQYDSPVRAVMRGFILSEADVFNTYIQNRQYGWNAHASYIYKADIVSKNKIFAGENVTQRTDFKEVTIESNADVQFIACKTIYLKPGFHAKAGSKFHAKIDTDNCAYCTHSELAPSNGHTIREIIQEVQFIEPTIAEETSPIHVYPNPGIERVTLEVLDKQVTSFDYTVYDIAGKLIGNGAVEGKLTQLNLEKGVYIIRTKINETWYVKKLIMR